MATMPMTTMNTGPDGALLHLLQLVSPALPVGAFSYSEGLEALQQVGALADAAALQCWLAAEVQGGAVAIETAALAELAAALGRWRDGDLGAAASVAELDRWLLVQREAPELRAQQLQMGRSLLQLLDELCGRQLPGASLAWPAAFAWAGVCLQIGDGRLELAYLYGWVANQISAAVRLIPLGPTEGQRLQLGLAPLIAQRASELASSDPRQLWSSGVGAGLAQLRHAELYSRLFRS